MLPPPRASISGLRAARERDERIGADVERQPEALARGLHERVGDVVAIGERDAVDEEVEPAVLLLDAGEHRVDLGVVLHVERQHERLRREGLGELVDVLFEAPLIGEDERRARLGRRLRDRPRERPLVRDADDQAHLAREMQPWTRTDIGSSVHFAARNVEL